MGVVGRDAGLLNPMSGGKSVERLETMVTDYQGKRFEKGGSSELL